MRELAVQAGNDTLDDDDRAASDAEFQQLESEIDRIAANTTFAGESCLMINSKTFHIGTGNAESDKVAHTFTNITAEKLDLASNTVDAVVQTAGAGAGDADAGAGAGDADDELALVMQTLVLALAGDADAGAGDAGMLVETLLIPLEILQLPQCSSNAR